MLCTNPILSYPIRYFIKKTRAICLLGEPQIQKLFEYDLHEELCTDPYAQVL